MKARQLTLLAVVVVALLALNMYQKSSHRKSVSRSDTAAVLDVDINVDQINRVTVSQGNDSTRVVLERLPDRWVTRSAWGHSADTRKVTELIEALNSLRGEFRSESAEVLADYGLGSEAEATPVTVTLYGNEWSEVASLEMGSQSPSGGVFVREPGSDTAYLSRTNVLGKLGMWNGPSRPENRTFLNLDVFECDRNDIRTISLFTDSTTLVLEKSFAEPDSSGYVDFSSWEWMLTSPERMALAKTKVDGIMNAMTKLQAADIDDPKANWESYGLWKAARRVEIGMADGSTFELRWGLIREKAEGVQDGVYVMTSKDKTIWVIREFKADQIFKSLEDLLPDA